MFDKMRLLRKKRPPAELGEGCPVPGRQGAIVALQNNCCIANKSRGALAHTGNRPVHDGRDRQRDTAFLEHISQRDILGVVLGEQRIPENEPAMNKTDSICSKSRAYRPPLMTRRRRS
jgi:hypothetical protein